MTATGDGGDPPCWAHLFDEGDPGDSTSQRGHGPVVVDLGSVAEGSGGAIWSLPHGGDLDVNMVRLDPGDCIGEHVNDEVDVMLYIRSGDGSVTIDGATNALGAGHLAVIPLGALRSITAGRAPLNYLSVHRRRNPLQIGEKPPSPAATDALGAAGDAHHGGLDPGPEPGRERGTTADA